MSGYEVVKDLDPTEYRKRPGLSQSAMKVLGISPAHFKAALSVYREQTKAQELGEVVHTTVLEPGTFTERYYVLPRKYDRRLKADKEELEAHEISAAGKIVIDEETAKTALAISDKCWNHPAACHLLKNNTEKELSLFWTEEPYGVRCKARIDGYAEKIQLADDLKTTASASPGSFSRSVFDFGYHYQAAFYLRGLRACGIVAKHFCFIAVENKAPFEVAVYKIAPDAIDLANMQIDKWLETYAKCLERDEWPGYSEAFEVISLPAWGMKAMQESLGIELEGR